MSDGPLRVEVDGSVYQLRRWSYEDGRLWLFRLLSLATKGTGAGASSDEAAMGAMLDAMGETTFVAFTTVVEKYTDLVRADDDGRETIVELSRVSKVHMQGRYLDLAFLLRAHIEQEFAPFFGRIGEVLGGAKRTAS